MDTIFEKSKQSAENNQSPSALVTSFTLAEASAVAIEASGMERALPEPKLLKRLLVPLDGTREGEQALPYATALAHALHAHIVLGHVTPICDVNKLAQGLPVAGNEQQLAQQAFAPHVLPYFQELRWRLPIPLDQVSTQHLSALSVTDGLLELEATNEIDLVILGLRTHASAGHLSLGKVVDSLMRIGSVPMLVIPPKADTFIRPFTLWHILLPLDGSALAEEALAPLLGLLTQTQREPETPLTITLLGVAENYAVLPHYQSYLNSIRTLLMTTPTCANVQVLIQAIVGSAPGAIVGALDYGTGDSLGEKDGGSSIEPVDLAIMATHGRGGIERWLFGSVADYVLPRVQVPVLLVHPTHLDQ